jgi:hypothetical protein
MEVIGGVTVNSGYVCCNKYTDNTDDNCGCTISCQWLTTRTPKDGFLDFIRPDGSHAIVTPDGCHCPKKYTIRVPNVTDPYTNEVGVGCKLSDVGLNDLNKPSSVLINLFESRKDGSLPCYGFDRINN